MIDHISYGVHFVNSSPYKKKHIFLELFNLRDFGRLQLFPVETTISA